MGYTVLLQWTFTATPRAALSEIIITRVLEHYNISQAQRTTIQIRTFRSQTSTDPSNPTVGTVTAKYLTTLAYSQPIAPGRSEVVNQARDDVTYVFLEDRGISAETEGKGKERFQTIAVRPAAALLPLLTNLLSPFVLGVTKSARQAASTTAQHPTPTVLPGQQYLLQSIIFPPLSGKNPPLVLTVHTIPSAPNIVILEGEWEGAAASEEGDAVLKEFLAGCLPDGVGGDQKFITRREKGGLEDWEGIERSRKVTAMLAQTLREQGLI